MNEIDKFLKEADKFMEDPIGYGSNGVKSHYLGKVDYYITWYTEPRYRLFSNTTKGYYLHVVISPWASLDFSMYDRFKYGNSIDEIARMKKDVKKISKWYKKQMKEYIKNDSGERERGKVSPSK